MVRMIRLMTNLWILGAALVGPLIVRNVMRSVFGDPAVAWREVRRFPPLRVCDVTSGAVRLTGRVVAAPPPLVSPVGGKPCVFYQLQVRTLGLLGRTPLYPDHEVSFEIDDGSGRALVRVPPPPPPPEPGDETAWEVVCAIGGERLSRRLTWGESVAFDRIYHHGNPRGTFIPVTATEGIIAAGDLVIVAGHASTEIVPDGQASSYRTPPTRVTLTSAAGYRLAIVKTETGDV